MLIEPTNERIARAAGEALTTVPVSERMRLEGAEAQRLDRLLG